MDQQNSNRYCSTPMAPPPSASPAPPSAPIQHQHHPPPSMSPAPQQHPGYYSHNPLNPYPPQQHSYYTNMTNYPTYNASPQPQHYQHQQQQQQQWNQHHGYYQHANQNSQPPQQHQQQQTSGYPPHSPSPNHYASYIQHQPQPPSIPQQHQHPAPLPLSSPPGASSLQSQTGLVGSQQSQNTQQPHQQMQTAQQHALMNLSRFVSQQSPCPSPSPTTPVPMGSPHYPQQVTMQQSQSGHMISQGQPHNNIHSQHSQPQHHHHHPPMPSTTPTPPLCSNTIHQSSSYSPTTVSAHQQLSHPSQNILSGATNPNNVNSMSNVPINNFGNAFSSDGVHNIKSNSIVNKATNNDAATVKNHPPFGSANGGTSGSSSPTGSNSGRPLSSPPAVTSSSGSNGQLLPVRLQNMQKGARTKASMRKLMQEQQSSSNSQETVPEGISSDQDTESESKQDQQTKRSPKKPKSPKKGAQESDKADSKITRKSKEGAKKRTSKTVAAADSTVNPESPSVVRPGYTKRGIKIGRPLKARSSAEESEPSKKVRKSKKSSAIEAETPSSTSIPVNEKIDSPTKSVEESFTNEISPEVKESPIKTKDSEILEMDTPPSDTISKSPAKRSNKRTKSNPKKGKKKMDEDWKLGGPPSTESESEVEPSPEIEIQVTPRRPLRPRVSKETPKSEEPEVSLRSRQARARRASSSYKEISMSSSRSKSPKEVPLPKKSPRGTSPSKIPGKVNTRKSSSRTTTPKSSPRLKEASPSPVRVRQLKAQSPDISRELRSSKEREDSPKRPSRTRTAKEIKESPETSETPSSRRSSKSPRDQTPIRVSSPRLAKEKKAAEIKKKTLVKTKKTVDAKSASPERKSKESVTKNNKKPLRSRQSKFSADITVTQTELIRKKSLKKTRSGNKKRKSHQKKLKIETEAANTSTDNQKNETEEEQSQTDLSIEETPSASEDNKLTNSSKLEDTKINSTEYFCKQDLGIQNIEVKTKSNRRTSVASNSSRRSKSPRGSLHPPDTITITSNNAVLLAQCSSPRVIIPHLSVDDFSKKYGDESPESLRINRLTQQVTAVIPSIEPLGEEPTTQENIGLEPLENASKVDDKTLAEEKISETTKAKKPRKPKTLKVQEPPDQIEKASAKQKIKLAEKLEFQQRKANLEVEVAQVLLNLKNFDSPSPLKNVDPIILHQTIIPVSEVVDTLNPHIKSTKSKKRKNSELSNNETDLSTFSSVNLDPSGSTKASSMKSKKKSRYSDDICDLTAKNLPHFSEMHSTLDGTMSLFPSSTSISFQNSPLKVSGPVKVSKTVTIPEGDTRTVVLGASKFNLDQAVKSSDGKSPPVTEKPKKKKKMVIPKALTPTPVPNTEDTNNKKKYKRKKSKDAADNHSNVEPKKPFIVDITKPSIGKMNVNVSSLPSMLEKVTKKSKASIKPTLTVPTPKSSSDAATGGSDKVVKKRKKSSTPKIQKPLPFQLQPKSIPPPTIFVKPSPFASFKNGPTAGTSGNESKDKALVGPSLKVIRGRTKFYRGSDEEELDTEPPLPKRSNTHFDPNVPWLCCFCNLGPHAQKLGDLFGPYFAEPSLASVKTKSVDKQETWMHQDCALWAGNVVLIGTKLHNLEETLAHSSQDPCTTCGQKGATIGCLKRGCKQAVHYPCAIRKSWKLDEETFQSFCPAHVT